MPADIRFHDVMNQALVISQVTENTSDDAIMGAILAIILIFAFLRDWRPTLTIALTIPLSVITTFIGLYAFDYTLNIMTLGGLALGVGNLVDNAVVVIENTFRHMDEEGEDRDTAAKRGAGEVAMAVTASTLTTIHRVSSMVLSTGIAGRLSRPLAVAVTISQVASLLVGLTIVPMIASVIFKKGAKTGRSDQSSAQFLRCVRRTRRSSSGRSITARPSFCLLRESLS